jgi:flagellar motility protein MotE (MotC chaperone)
MNRILQSPATIVLTGSLTFLLTVVILLSTLRLGTPASAGRQPLMAEDDPSWKFRNPEFDQWVAQLKDERDALAVREGQLKEWEQRLAAESHEISSVTQAVGRLQAQFDQRVLLFKDQEKDNVKRQIKVISDMSPDGAAAMLGQMTDDEITRTLYAMKPDVSGPILDAMSKQSDTTARRAATIADRLKDVLPVSATNSPTNASP